MAPDFWTQVDDSGIPQQGGRKTGEGGTVLLKRK